MRSMTHDDGKTYQVTNRAGYYQAWLITGQREDITNPNCVAPPRDLADDAVKDLNRMIKLKPVKHLAMVMFTPWNAKDPVFDREPIYQFIPSQNGGEPTIVDSRRNCRSLELRVRKQMVAELMKQQAVEFSPDAAEQFMGAMMDAMIGMLCYSACPNYGIPLMPQVYPYDDAIKEFCALLDGVVGNRKIFSSQEIPALIDAVLSRCGEHRAAAVAAAELE